jgi:hypothetical protein
MIDKLVKKLGRLQRKYEKLPKGAKVRQARLMKTYEATARQIRQLTGKDYI